MWFTIVMLGLGVGVLICGVQMIREHVPKPYYNMNTRRPCPVCTKQIQAILANKDEFKLMCYHHQMWLQNIESMERAWLDSLPDYTLHNLFFKELEQSKSSRIGLPYPNEVPSEVIMDGDGNVIETYLNREKIMYVGGGYRPPFITALDVRPPEYDEYVILDGNGREISRSRI